MSLEIRVATSLPVLAVVVDEAGQVYRFVCGTSSEPFPIPGGSYVKVWLVAGRSGNVRGAWAF
jgi:hypothetical protein